MKKILILFTILAVTITAFSVCSVSAADEGRFYNFRPNFDFDTQNPSYLYQGRLPLFNLDRPWERMDVMIQHGAVQKIDPSDYDGEYASFEFRPIDPDDTHTGLILPLGVSSFSTDGAPVRMSHEDTLYVEAGRFYIEVDTPLDALVKARFTIRPVWSIDASGNSTFSYVYASTETVDIYVAEGARAYFDYPLMDFLYTEFDEFRDGITTPVFLCLEFIFSTADGIDITVINAESTNVKIFYGQGSNPNNPVYPPADGGNIGNLEDTEQELIGSQEQGLNNTGAVIGNAENVMIDLNTDLQLGAFVTALNPILDRLAMISGIDSLVNMSIALGLFASLLSLSASIIGAGDRRERMKKQRENSKSGSKKGE